MLPPRFRLSRPRIKTVIQKGRGQSFVWGTIKFLPRTDRPAGPSPRFAVVVPAAAVKKATARNLLKRRLRALLARSIAPQAKIFDTVLFLKNGTVASLKLKELSAMIVDSFKKSRLI